LLLLISDSGYAATRRIYINFDNRPAVNPSTGSFTPDTSPGIGDLRINYWGGTGQHTPSVEGMQHQYVTGRTGTGYALSGLIGADSVGTWPYIYWYGVDQDVSWSNNIYVSFWMKYVNFIVADTYKKYENIKLFYWFFNPDTSAPELSGEIAVSSPPAGSPPSYNEYYYSWRGKYPYNKNYGNGYPQFNDCDGKWHHYEFYIQRKAGRARMFVDGVTRVDWNSGDPNNFGNGTYIHAMHIAGSLVGTGPNSKGTRIFDDIEVWDDAPDTFKNFTTPPSTSEKSPNPPIKLSIQ